VKRHRLIHFLTTVTVISVALVTLVGLQAERGSLAGDIAGYFLRLVSVTAAVAVAVGLLNLLGVHLGRFVHAERGWPYSLIALVTALIVIVLRILDRAEVWKGDLEDEQLSARLFEAVQVSLEAALASLLVFFLVYAAYRLMRREVTIWNTIFSLALIVVLIGWIPAQSLGTLGGLRDWFVEIPVSAGARGILIGVALGTLMVGVRVLTGQDRSIRG
jgi:hypothetical protein